MSIVLLALAISAAYRLEPLSGGAEADSTWVGHQKSTHRGAHHPRREEVLLRRRLSRLPRGRRRLGCARGRRLLASPQGLAGGWRVVRAVRGKQEPAWRPGGCITHAAVAARVRCARLGVPIETAMICRVVFPGPCRATAPTLVPYVRVYRVVLGCRCCPMWGERWERGRHRSAR